MSFDSVKQNMIEIAAREIPINDYNEIFNEAPVELMLKLHAARMARNSSAIADALNDLFLAYAADGIQDEEVWEQIDQIDLEEREPALGSFA